MDAGMIRVKTTIGEKKVVGTGAGKRREKRFLV